MRSILGVADLDTLLSNREHLNESLQDVIDAQTEPWGIKVTSVEIKDVEIPERMQHAIARQAEAERERRAKIINAEGEVQAAAKLADAADVIGLNPVTLQLRYLQTLREIGVNQNSTVVFPMPIDLIKPMLDVLDDPAGRRRTSGTADGSPPSRAGRDRTELGAGPTADLDGAPGTADRGPGAAAPEHPIRRAAATGDADRETSALTSQRRPWHAAKTSATSRSSPTSITARRRWSTPCCGSPARFANQTSTSG